MADSPDLLPTTFNGIPSIGGSGAPSHSTAASSSGGTHDDSGKGSRLYTPARAQVVAACFVLMFVIVLQHNSFQSTLRELFTVIKEKELEFIKTDTYRIHASLYVGRLLTMLPTGALLVRSTRIMNYLYSAMVLSSVGLLMAPTCLTTHLSSTLFAFCLVGMGHGVAIITMVALLVRWIPRLEYSRVITFIFAAYAFAALVSDAVGEIVMHFMGWKYVYYANALYALLVLLPVWWKCIKESPQQANVCRSEASYLNANTVSVQVYRMSSLSMCHHIIHVSACADDSLAPLAS
jgi:hypothetical protein